MKAAKESIKQALSTVQLIGYTIPDEITRALSTLDNPVYRVAVVGKFQVGKSTLINRLFLGGDSLLGLSEGNGFRCETSVATDVEYGSASRLEVYNWTADGNEEMSLAKDNPTAEDVRAATVASSERKRSELAANVSRVRLVAPNETLKGFVILDTPGLDDPNKELLLNTTYRIVPRADLALLVVEPKQLDTVVDDFLRKTLIEQGVKRLMVLVSYNPDKGELDRAERKNVIETIKAQLEKIGRPDIPVVMYCYDSSVSDIISDVSELRLTISTFLRENALKGRTDRVSFAARQYLKDIELELAAKIRASRSSEEEKTALKAKVDAQIATFKKECEVASSVMAREFEKFQSSLPTRVVKALDVVFCSFIQKSNDAKTVDAIKQCFDEKKMRYDLEQKVLSLDQEVKTEFSAIVNRHVQRLSTALTSWNCSLKSDFDINSPFLLKIPQFVWNIIDGLSIAFLPIAPMFRVIAGALAKAFHISLCILVKPILLKQVKSAIEESRGQVCDQICDQMLTNTSKAFARVKEEMDKSSQSQIDRMKKTVSVDVDEPICKDLEQNKLDISNAIAALAV